MAIYGAVELTEDGLEPEVPLNVVQVFDVGIAPPGKEFEEEVRAVVDTGFTGELTLPEEHIRELGYSYWGTIDGTLADGSEVQMNLYEGRILWHDRDRDILVGAADGQALVGMELLSGSRLTVEATPGGEVRIEEL